MMARHLKWVRLGAMAAGFLLAAAALLGPAGAEAPAAKPNILFIMGDDIGWMQVEVYHRGLALGETPNIDRIGQEGAVFTDYYAMQSCTSGRNVFFTGMYPLRTNVPAGPELRAQGVDNNQQLSLRRAQTVANFLVSQRVNPNLVSAQGLGDTDPVAPNDTPQGRAQNRRVELTLAGPGN
jgi:arylsulfatase A-like enzyme